MKKFMKFVTVFAIILVIKLIMAENANAQNTSYFLLQPLLSDLNVMAETQEIETGQETSLIIDWCGPDQNVTVKVSDGHNYIFIMKESSKNVEVFVSPKKTTTYVVEVIGECNYPKKTATIMVR